MSGTFVYEFGSPDMNLALCRLKAEFK